MTWALLGAGATVVITSWRGEDERRVEPEVVAEASDESFVAVTPLVEVTPLVASTPTGAPDPLATTAAPEPTPSTLPAAAPTAALEIPLPTMPGARVMKRGQRRDEEHGGWILTIAISVPAPGAQVEAFYRSALVDAGLAVTGGGSAPATMDAGHRGWLRGRNREANVNVNLHQRAGKLRTVVRIIWRMLP